MTPTVAKTIWILGVVAWFVIRYPYQRRSRRTPKQRQADRTRELILMAISATGLGVVPFIYVVAQFPAIAEYPFQPVSAYVGTVAFAAALWLFRRTHKGWNNAFRLGVFALTWQWNYFHSSAEHTARHSVTRLTCAEILTLSCAPCRLSSNFLTILYNLVALR